MDIKFVKVRFNVRCKWKGEYPAYRIYVNHELFAERTYIWDETTHIKEMLQVQATPGIYEYWLEPIPPLTGEFAISKPYIEIGNAEILTNNRFRIF